MSLPLWKVLVLKALKDEFVVDAVDERVEIGIKFSTFVKSSDSFLLSNKRSSRITSSSTSFKE